jgi:ATP-binding cassette subfamily F protein uup
LINFVDGQVSSRYPTPFSVYQQLRAEPRKVSQSSPAAIPPKREEKSPSTKLTWKEQRELESLETQVETLEARKAILQAEINASGSDYVRLQALAEQLQTLEVELETILTRWFELSELAGDNRR